MTSSDTIFALSSGAPPAAIAIVRISGPAASAALRTLAGRMPTERRAATAVLRDGAGVELDRALVLWMPGPTTSTGEDIAELHLHGGRAVVAAVEAALGAIQGLRKAQAGEFTRRAFANGRIDLAEAEGLADLLTAETELQRRAALAMAGGALSQQVEAWQLMLLTLSAQVEAVLDFGDEDDVAELPPSFGQAVQDLAANLAEWLDRPGAEPLREGFRVVLAGPPNAGKSTLFNALVEQAAAITASTPGTTRDVLERPVAIDGVPFTFIDTAGLRVEGADAVEQEGVERAKAEFGRADLVLWLGPEGEGPDGAIEVAAKADLGLSKVSARFSVSAATGLGVRELKAALVDLARQALPVPGAAALNRRQRVLLAEAYDSLTNIGTSDPLLVAERVRRARVAFDLITGRASTENMLDALFGRFCIGK